MIPTSYGIPQSLLHQGEKLAFKNAEPFSNNSVINTIIGLIIKAFWIISKSYFSRLILICMLLAFIFIFFINLKEIIKKKEKVD